jgi:hypothetical protein
MARLKALRRNVEELKEWRVPVRVNWKALRQIGLKAQRAQRHSPRNR